MSGRKTERVDERASELAGGVSCVIYQISDPGGLVCDERFIF